MISKGLFLKAQNIVVVEVKETEKTVFVDLVYCDNFGRHEHTVSWDKSIEPKVENILELLYCDCTICSSFHIYSKELCALKIRTVKELVKRNFWKPEMWKLIVENVVE